MRGTLFGIKKRSKKNTTLVKMKISKNPTDKSFQTLLRNFCQLDFWIFAFLGEWCFFY